MTLDVLATSASELTDQQLDEVDGGFAAVLIYIVAVATVYAFMEGQSD